MLLKKKIEDRNVIIRDQTDFEIKYFDLKS